MDEELTEKRKEEHVKRAFDPFASYTKTTLFEFVEFIPHSLPDLNYEDISLKIKAFNTTFEAPIYISGMTGGFKGGERINKALAKACESEGIPFGVGSQRAMIENPALTETYDVKSEAPGVFLIGNIGAYQLKQYRPEKILDAADKIKADAVAVHINPLQEMIQPEGDKDWKGVREALERFVEASHLPVIIKEVGAGISPELARELKAMGIEWVDIAGSGGTSWSRIEYLRGGWPKGFEDWGIETALALIEVAEIPGLNVLASGGIRSGIDGAKAISLGAKMFGAAKPFLEAYQEGVKKGDPSEEVRKKIQEWKAQLRGVMFLTNSERLEDLREKIYIWGTLREKLESIREQEAKNKRRL